MALDQALLHNKVSIVTGGSSGIGKATAFALAEKGSCVVLASRNLSALDENVKIINENGGKAWAIPVDVTKKDQVERMVKQVLDEWGKIDILISNAGQYIRSPIVHMDVALLEQSMSINFYSHVFVVLAVIPHMLEQKDGNIVFVSTMDAKKGLPPDVPYVSAKCALTGFAEVLRQEVRSEGIYVTTVFPGRIDTPLIENLKVPWISAKIPAEAVSRAILKGIRTRKAEIFLPPQVKLLHYLNVLSPRAADWVVRSFNLDGWEINKIIEEEKP
jgi:NAD(P)-dependent dehydrogenase (short-subunit alcohol dehydrogenase family)